jgi:molybdopterin converting factor small subunit
MADLNVEFYGVFAEITGTDKLLLSNIENTIGLKQILFQKYPALKKFNCMIAIDNKIVNDNIELYNVKCFSFMPPFSGG